MVTHLGSHICSVHNKLIKLTHRLEMFHKIEKGKVNRVNERGEECDAFMRESRISNDAA